MTDEGRSAERQVAALIAVGRWEDAAQRAAEGLAVHPDDAVLHGLRGACLHQLRRYEEARSCYETAARLAPDQPDTLVGLARARWKLGRPFDAIDELWRAAQLDPTNAVIQIYLCEVYVDIARQTVPQDRRRRIDQAAAHAWEAVRLDPNDAEAHLALARVANVVRDTASMRHHAGNALRLDPEHHIAHQILGLAAEYDKDHGQAAEHLRQAGRLEPSSALVAEQFEQNRRRSGRRGWPWPRRPG